MNRLVSLFMELHKYFLSGFELLGVLLVVDVVNILMVDVVMLTYYSRHSMYSQENIITSIQQLTAVDKRSAAVNELESDSMSLKKKKTDASLSILKTNQKVISRVVLLLRLPLLTDWTFGGFLQIGHMM